MPLNQNALQIDPETGAVIVNGLRIEPEWTVEKLRESEFYKRYIHDDEIEKMKIFLIPNLNGKRLIISIYYFRLKKTLGIDKMEFEFSNGGRAEDEEMRFDDFNTFREILVESFTGYEPEDNDDEYMSYEFRWGSIVLCINQRDLYTSLDINYK